MICRRCCPRVLEAVTSWALGEGGGVVAQMISWNTARKAEEGYEKGPYDLLVEYCYSRYSCVPVTVSDMSSKKM